VYAIIFNPDTGSWERHSRVDTSWSAHCAADVPDVLKSAEAAAEGGATVIGYVSYEAAAGFDDSLPARPGGTLAQFACFGAVEPMNPPYAAVPVPSLSPSLRASEHAEQVERVQRYLEAGDSYQVNLTFPMKGSLGTADPEALFWTLFHRQPGPYACLLDFGDRVICSLSPELFFSRDEDRVATEPMKGTRKRGKDYIADEQARTALSASQKDRAENLMIVDMVRNDLGKVAVPGSVSVDSLFHIRGTPSVWQKVSRVSARSHAPTSALFTALFPCASITGAPKRRSMEIIAELEASARGVYTGAVGWMKPERRAQFAVAIRSLVIERRAGKISYGTGGGIVWDSEPEDEWQEALAKCALLTDAGPEFDLLETLAWDSASGSYKLLDNHMRRLGRSAAYLNRPFDEAAARRALEKVRGTGDQRVRLTVDASGAPQIGISALSAPRTPVRLRLAAAPVSRHDIFLQHKTTYRRAYEDARASRSDCDDVVLWNEEGEITETTIYNLFLRRDDQLLTPEAKSGLLPGTLREALLERGEAVATRLTLQDLDHMDEILVGNGVRGLLPAILLR
jgi:para-aminobenzoate synthetase/4-amino-4-deoxychorismate lyase